MIPIVRRKISRSARKIHLDIRDTGISPIASPAQLIASPAQLIASPAQSMHHTPLTKLYRQLLTNRLRMPFEQTLPIMSLIMVAHMRISFVFSKLSQDKIETLRNLMGDYNASYAKMISPVINKWYRFIRSACVSYNVSSANSDHIQKAVHKWLSATLHAMSKPTPQAFHRLIVDGDTAYTTMNAVNPKIYTDLCEYRKKFEPTVKDFFKIHGEAFLQKVAEVEASLLITGAMDVSDIDDAVFLKWQ